MSAAAVAGLERRGREVGPKRPRLSADFPAAHRREVSVLTLREACRTLPEGERRDLTRRHRCEVS